jgi:HSP20 family protein
MLGLTRWNPFSELDVLHRDLDALFGRAFGDASAPWRDWHSMRTPEADVTRDGDKWTIHVSVPGVAPEKLDVSVEGRTLRVRGERQRGSAPESGETILREIGEGRFEREFTLPDEIDADHVDAKYVNGIISLTLPIKESAKPRRIPIDGSAETKELRAA